LKSFGVPGKVLRVLKASPAIVSIHAKLTKSIQQTLHSPAVLSVRQRVDTVIRTVNPPTITVDANRVVTRVPRRLFGTNLRQNMQFNDEFIKQTGITLFRYPDAVDNGYSWDWNAGGVMMKQGKHLTSKLAFYDWALALGEKTKSELFYTMNIYDNTPEEAARWVAEAKKRGGGGSYWCLGNEPYFKGEKLYIPKEKYVDLVRKFAPAMKAADPTIRIGIAWGGPYIEEHQDEGRDSYVLRHTKDYVDFIDFHFYTGRYENSIEVDRIMAGSLLVGGRVNKFRKIFKREAPEKADLLEIHFWEWNAHGDGMLTLANALFAADALGEFAANGISAAMQYNLQERPCGLIPGWEQESPTYYATQPWDQKTIRPIAYALQIWSHEMGSLLVHSKVSGVGSYQVKDWHTWVNYQGKVPNVATHATKSDDGKNLQVLVINKSGNPITVTMKLKGFIPQPEIEVIDLHGNPWHRNDWTNVPPISPRRSTWSGAAEKFTYTYPAYSLTVLKMKLL
jgi:hypothetical protein